MKTIQIFLGGGVKLLHGENESIKGYRNAVIDPLISKLNSKEYTTNIFIIKDFSDLTRNVVKEKQQEVYNNYIVQDAQIALFIIDGKIGEITKEEIEVAVASTRKKRHPIVFIYGKNIKEDADILQYLKQKGIYFQHFYDNRDLAAKIESDLNTSVYKLGHNKHFSTWHLMLVLFLFCGIVVASLYKPIVSHPPISIDSIESIYIPVNLGLPSGTLWSDRNVGANSESDYGDYYAWGAIHTIDSLGQPDWKRYRKEIIEFKDVASNSSNGEWQIPTKNQFEELLTCCIWKIDTIKGNIGYRVSSKKDSTKYIFLPAAGSFQKLDVEDVNKNGYYWTCDPDPQNEEKAYELHFHLYQRLQRAESAPKVIGRSIRAVCVRSVYKEVER